MGGGFLFLIVVGGVLELFLIMVGGVLLLLIFFILLSVGGV